MSDLQVWKTTIGIVASMVLEETRLRAGSHTASLSVHTFSPMYIRMRQILVIGPVTGGSFASRRPHEACLRRVGHVGARDWRSGGGPR